MAQASVKRAVVERIVRLSREEAATKGKRIQTIDPVLRMTRRLFPYLSDRELQEYSSAALRAILVSGDSEVFQSTLALR